MDELHVVVSDMHAELLALSSQASFRGRSLIRSFQHRQNPDLKLDISAALLRQYPALSIFVCYSPPAFLSPQPAVGEDPAPQEP